MTVLQTIAVAFAMFSALPVPQFEWNEKNMRYAMCAFPLIGLVCGGLWCLCGDDAAPEVPRKGALAAVERPCDEHHLQHSSPLTDGQRRQHPQLGPL